MPLTTVLLIEDNEDDEKLTRRALLKNNVANEVVVALDGKEAFELLYGPTKGDREPLRPALIVLDVHLPGMSGLAVLERIRSEERTRFTPVVILTAESNEATAQDAYRLGANSYVVKPTDLSEFTDTVLNLAMYWLLLNVPVTGRA